MKCELNGLTKPDWEPISFYILNPANERGSFSSLIGGGFAIDGRLLNNQRIWNILSICAEMLPIETENGDTLYIVNVTQCLSALDVTQTIRDKSWDSVRNVPAKGRILKYAFHKERLNHATLLKIPEEIGCSVFTHTGTHATEDDFFTVYHQLGLTGLKFEEVWEGG